MTKENLKICCFFTEFMEANEIKTKLEKDLAEMFWSYLEKKGDLCKKCNYNGKREKK